MPTWQQPTSEADLLTIQEVASSLRVHPSTVSHYIKLGLLAAIELPSGGKRIPRTELQRILSQTTTTNVQPSQKAKHGKQSS